MNSAKAESTETKTPQSAAAPAKPNPNAKLLAIPEMKPLLENYLKTRRTEIDALAVKYLRALDGKLNQSADSGDLDLAKAFQGEKN